MLAPPTSRLVEPALAGYRPITMRLLFAVTAVLALAACGEDTGSRAEEPSAGGDAPTPTGQVTTAYPVTVIDDGEGAELCLGGVEDSLPPQCGGPTLVGWDWADHEGDYEQRSGTRWGEFVVAGTFDGEEITPTEVVPASEFVPSQAGAPEHDNQFPTPCPEPAGGWVVDPQLTTFADFDRAFKVASRLDGYADAWVDQSRDTRTPEEMDLDAAAGAEGVDLWTINVRVTGDPAAAEAELREVWGGGLCVTQAEHTDKELRAVQKEVGDVDGMLSSSVSDQRVELYVTYDDGSLQRELDEKYGDGMVVVGSALQPVED